MVAGTCEVADGRREEQRVDRWEEGALERRPPCGGDHLLGDALRLPDEMCPLSTEGGTRRVQLVRKEGRDVSS